MEKVSHSTRVRRGNFFKIALGSEKIIIKISKFIKYSDHITLIGKRTDTSWRGGPRTYAVYYRSSGKGYKAYKLDKYEAMEGALW